MSSPEQTLPHPPPQEKSGLAIASLILGLAGFLLIFFTGIPAIITGHMARARIEKSGGAIGGSGMALAGLILGYLTTLLLPIILAGLLTPVILKAKKNADLAQSINSMRFLSTELHEFHSRHQSYPKDELASSLQLPEATGPRVLEQLQIPNLNLYLTVKDHAQGDWLYNPNATKERNDILLISPFILNKAAVIIADGSISLLPETQLQQIIDSMSAPPVAIPSVPYGR